MVIFSIEAFAQIAVTPHITTAPINHDQNYIK